MKKYTTKMIRLFVLLCITAMISAERSQVHEEMTDDEIIYTFGPLNDEASPVPEYEVVPVAHSVHERSPDHRILELTSFERNMRFYLEPTDGYLAGVNTKVYRAKHKPGMINDIEYTLIPGAIEGKYQMYQDAVNNAAVVINHDSKGLPLINGIINQLNQKRTLVIRPLVPRLRQLFGKRFKREISQSNRTVEHPNLEFTHHHVVYKIPHSNTNDDYENSNNDDYNYENNEVDDEEEDEDEHHVHLESDEQLVGDEAHGHVDLIAFGRGKRKRFAGHNKVPEIVYPQALVIIQSDYFNLFKRNVNSIVEYLLAFWNGVDLRYRVYQKPEMRLNIAGIILAEDSTMTTYIHNNHVNIPQFKKSKINVTQALRAKAAFMYPETTFNETDQTLTMKRLGLKFDFAITMTTLDMCQLPANCADEVTRNYTCNINKVHKYCDTLGFAYYTGGCAYDSEYEEMEAVGIIEDAGNFFGIVPTAHEIGHLLGASHDKYNKHGCDVDDGYLMSYSLTLTKDSFVWSNCSVESVKFFLAREPRAQCMFDKPDTGKVIPRKLPGKIFTRDELCDRAVGTRSCPDSWYNQQCDGLYCVRKRPTKEAPCQRVRNHAVPEGASCGKEQYCINAECVNEKQSFVPLRLATTTTEGSLSIEEPCSSDEDDY